MCEDTALAKLRTLSILFEDETRRQWVLDLADEIEGLLEERGSISFNGSKLYHAIQDVINNRLEGQSHEEYLKNEIADLDHWVRESWEQD